MMRLCVRQALCTMEKEPCPKKANSDICNIRCNRRASVNNDNVVSADSGCVHQ